MACQSTRTVIRMCNAGRIEPHASNWLCALPYDLLVLLYTCYLDPVDALVLRCACRRLRTVIVYARIRDACKYRLYEHALQHAHMSRLDWLYANKQQCIALPRHLNLSGAAAWSDHLPALQWLHDRDALLDGHKNDAYYLCDLVVQRGNLAALQWLRVSAGCTFYNAVACATRNGHIHILEWLHLTRQIGCSPCGLAAQAGQLRVLQWLRAHHYDWDTKTCADAAAYRHLDVLCWAHENGCAWDDMTTYNAAHGGHVSILEYALQHGCAWHPRALCVAAQHGRVSVLEYARTQHSVQWNLDRAAVESVALHCNVSAVLAWLHCHVPI